MRVVQASFYRDPQNRTPEQLLEAWPTITAVARAAQEAGVDVKVVQAHASNHSVGDGLVRFSDNVEAAIQQLNADVLHISGLQFSRYTKPLLRRLPGLKVVVQNRGGHAAARWQRPWIRWGLSHVHGVLFTARTQIERHRGALPAHVPIFEVVDSSTHFTVGDQASARATTGLAGNPCVLWVGRLNPNKDPLTALRAVREAARELPDIRLYCCFGSTELLDEVASFIKADSVLGSRVVLRGRIEHERLEQYYRAADLFISCSHTEGSGFALIEAIGCGLFPVVSNIPSFRKITGDGAIAELVAPGDYAGFGRALVRAHQHRSSTAQVRAHFERCLSFEIMGRDLRSVYETVLS